MTSTNTNNVLQLQSALRNMEERYKKLQDKASSLEIENERLIASRSELVTEIERLQDQQIKLRERNLRLTHEYSSKQQECSLLAEKLMLFARGRVTYNKNSGTYVTVDPNRPLEAQEKSRVVNIAMFDGHSDQDSYIKSLTASSRTLSEPNLMILQNELDVVRKGLWSPVVGSNQSSTVGELSSSILAGLKKAEGELDVTKAPNDSARPKLELLKNQTKNQTNSQPPDKQASKAFCSLCCSKMAGDVREKILFQNQKLKKLLAIVQSAGNDPSVAAGTQTSLDKQSISFSLTSSPERICPLCEESFSVSEPQEHFVDHVMGHFNDEDALAALQITA